MGFPLLPLLISATLLGCASRNPTTPSRAQLEQSLTDRYKTLTPESAKQILALNPDHLTEREIKDVLANAPAPRIIMLQGGLMPVQVAMKSFSQFIIGLGYPEWCARNPEDGAYSYSSFRNSSEIARVIAGYYEREGMRPMLLGHSLGGIQAVKVLQKLANASSPPKVCNPLTRKTENRRTIRDPLTGHPLSITNVQVCFASTLASGGLGRAIPHEWGMNFRLRKIPDTVEDFAGFYLNGDIFGGDFGERDLFHATGTARVRNLQLPPGTSHWTIPMAEKFFRTQEEKDLIDNYSPNAPHTDPAFQNNASLIYAAEVWHSIKRHWVIELQNYLRAKAAPLHDL